MTAWQRRTRGMRSYSPFSSNDTMMVVMLTVMMLVGLVPVAMTAGDCAAMNLNRLVCVFPH